MWGNYCPSIIHPSVFPPNALPDQSSVGSRSRLNYPPASSPRIFQFSSLVRSSPCARSVRTWVASPSGTKTKTASSAPATAAAFRPKGSTSKVPPRGRWIVTPFDSPTTASWKSTAGKCFVIESAENTNRKVSWKFDLRNISPRPLGEGQGVRACGSCNSKNYCIVFYRLAELIV